MLPPQLTEADVRVAFGLIGSSLNQYGGRVERPGGVDFPHALFLTYFGRLCDKRFVDKA